MFAISLFLSFVESRKKYPISFNIIAGTYLTQGDVVFFFLRIDLQSDTFTVKNKVLFSKTG